MKKQYQLADLNNGTFGEIYETPEAAQAAYEEAVAEGKALNLAASGGESDAGTDGTAVEDFFSIVELESEEEEEQAPFNFSLYSYKCGEYKAEWDSYLEGYIITFADGKQAQTQVDVEQNRLHADYGDEYLQRYTEYDDELTQEQHAAVEDFVSKVNKMQRDALWS